MTATSININAKRLNAMARRLMSESEKRTITTGEGKSVGLSMARQMLSQALFSVPYESLINQLNTATPLPKTLGENAAPPVLIVHYGSDAIITVNGVYTERLREQSADGVHQLEELATCLSEQFGVVYDDFNQVYLPELLGEEWEYNDVVLLAKVLGYFKHGIGIFDFLTETEGLRLNGKRVDCPLPIDWMANVEREFEQARQDIDDFESLPTDAQFTVFNLITAWDTMLEDDPSNTVYSFTLSDLVRAKYDGTFGTWQVPFEHGTVTLSSHA